MGRNMTCIMNIPKKVKEEEELTPEQQRRLALVEELCGAFSACQTVDWKKDKEEYLLEKNEELNDVRKNITDYSFEQVEKEMAELDAKGQWSKEICEEIANEHLRTPYVY